MLCPRLCYVPLFLRSSVRNISIRHYNRRERICVKFFARNSHNVIIRHRTIATSSKGDGDQSSPKSSSSATTSSFSPPKSQQSTTKEKARVKENIFTIPNALCVSRIALSPLLGYFVVNGQYVFGLSIFAYAAITDLLDGWIARTFPGQQSVLGSALDPMADKVLISVLVLSLTYVGLIPLWLTVLIVGRDLGLIAAGFVMRYISLDPPRTLARYFDVTAPSVRLKPTWISKINTGVQLGMVGCSLAAPVFGYADHSALYALWLTTGFTTCASGLTYLFAKDTYEVLLQRKRRAGKKQTNNDDKAEEETARNSRR